jgi:RNA polymerase sigma-70 factor (ECF subfamily)
VTIIPKRVNTPRGSVGEKRVETLFRNRIEPFTTLVYRVGLRITRNAEDAEDVQQESLLKAYRNLGQFEGRSLLRTWVTKIAQNEALMCLRKRREMTPLEDLELESTSTLRDDFCAPREGPEAAYLRKELRISLICAISSLQPEYRVVFILRAVQEFSTKETAKILHLSVHTAKTRMRRARLKIRARFQNPGGLLEQLGQAKCASDFD